MISSKSEGDEEHNLESFYAEIALGVFSHEDEVGGLVTDEELAAFIDKRLDQNERMAVLSKIANNPEIYRRLLNVYELKDLVETKTRVQFPSIGMIKRTLRSLMPAPKVWLSGGVFAVALVMALILKPLYFSYPGSVDELYAKYADSLSFGQNPGSKFPFRGEMFHSGKTTRVKVFEKGMVEGLELLGGRYQFEGLPVYKLYSKNDVIPAADMHGFNALYDIGKLTTLTYFYCQSESPGAGVIEDIGSFWKELVSQSHGEYKHLLFDINMLAGTENMFVIDFCDESISIVKSLSIRVFESQ